MQPSCKVVSYTACEWASELGRLHRADFDKAEEAMRTALSTTVGLHFTGASGCNAIVINGEPSRRGWMATSLIISDC